MATPLPPVVSQPARHPFSAQHISHKSAPTQDPSHDPLSIQEVEKSGSAVQAKIANVEPSDFPRTQRIYVPIALRTSLLAAFCVAVLLICALLQIAAAASLGAKGLESLAVYSPHARRGAHPQSSDPACPPGATCAPAAGNWTNPDSLNTSPYPTAPPGFVPTPTAPGPGSWTEADSLYFLGAYVPTLIAIMLSIWWKCVFARLKEMEPYYQLARTNGAEAKDSLILSYSNGMLPTVLFKSFRSKHWSTFVGAINAVFITLCTLFAAETLHLKGVGEGCGVIADAKGASNEDCKMQLAMQPELGFLLGAVLLAVFLGTLQLLRRLHRRQTGLSAEATSIAGIASLSHEIVVQRSTWQSQYPSHRFAILPSDADGTSETKAMLPAAQPTLLHVLEALRVTGPRPTSHYPWEMRIACLGLFLLYQIATLFLVVYYSFVTEPGTNNALEDFMDSESFGVRLFMTILGLGIKFYWGWIEKYVRHVSPLIAMAAPNGTTAQKSVLMPSHSHPITALFSRDTWSHRLLGLVTLMASLTEVLVVLLNTIPFSTATAYLAWRISVFMSIVVLTPMILTTPVVMLWSMKTKKNTAVRVIPECLADVLTMVQDTELWASLQGLSEIERINAVKSWHARFALREIEDRWRVVVIR